MIPEFTQAIFLKALDEWGICPARFGALAPEEKATYLKTQGYATLHDLLAHAGVWWEEGAAIIHDILNQVERPRRRYDFDDFNAAAMARFRDTPETEFMQWYRSEQSKMVALVSSLSEEQLKIRRVSGWLDAVVLLHLKEHGIGAPRFLVLDILRREWAAYAGWFQAKSAEEQSAFLGKQGFPRFRDLIAHIVAWWERVLESANQVAKDPAWRPAPIDVDAYNAQAITTFAQLDEAELWKKFEATREALIELVMNLPEETYEHPRVQAWLKADVIEHYFDHLG